MRSRHVLIALILVILAFGVGRLSAAPGTVDSPGGPDSGAAKMFTLEDIYNRLDTGAEDGPSTFTEPAAGPGTGTMHDLNEIMAQAPAIDNTDGATETNVLDGKTFWGLTGGQWGPQTGTAPDNGAVTIVPTTTNQTIALGYHDGSGHVEGDADLVASKIVSDVVIFEVTGSAIAATGNATAGDVLTGKSFSSASAAGIAGTMPDNGAVTITPTTTNQAIAAGYHNGSGEVLGDTDLVSGNIKCRVTIFGVTGAIPPDCVAKTGQTTSYATGDDGAYRKGCLPVVAPSGGYSFGGYNRTSFTCLDGATGFEDNGDGTVTDNLTGLVWLKNADCLGFVSWANALTKANGLASGSCGLTDGSSAGDWRLPNLNELRSLFDPGLFPLYLPAGHPFTDVKGRTYWSSTTLAGGASDAWLVILCYGRVGHVNKTANFYVWAVRGGQ